MEENDERAEVLYHDHQRCAGCAKVTKQLVLLRKVAEAADAVDQWARKDVGTEGAARIAVTDLAKSLRAWKERK